MMMLVVIDFFTSIPITLYETENWKVNMPDGTDKPAVAAADEQVCLTKGW